MLQFLGDHGVKPRAHNHEETPSVDLAQICLANPPAINHLSQTPRIEGQAKFPRQDVGGSRSELAEGDLAGVLEPPQNLIQGSISPSNNQSLHILTQALRSPRTISCGLGKIGFHLVSETSEFPLQESDIPLGPTTPADGITYDENVHVFIEA
jgi:hypothetical protein